MQAWNSLAHATGKSRRNADFSSRWSQELKQHHYNLLSLPPPALLISMLLLFLDKYPACSSGFIPHQVRKPTRKSMPFSSIDQSFCGNQPTLKSAFQWPSLAFHQTLKGRQRNGKALEKRKGQALVQVSSGWRLLVWGVWGINLVETRKTDKGNNTGVRQTIQ